MSDKRPNILFLSTDQQHYGALSATGNPYVHTPNMDWLMGAGVSFPLSYSANPVCGPARASYFTGMMASENGVTSNCHGGALSGALRRDRPTLGESVAGGSDYECVFAGKWHAGDCPFTYDIDGFDVILSGINRNGISADPSIAVATEAFIRNHDGSRPYLLVSCLQQPHDICETFRANSRPLESLPYAGIEPDELPPLPANFDYEHKASKAYVPRESPITEGWTELNWRFYLWSYYRHMEQTDATIGRILDALRDTGQLENTLIVFTSDHGEALGSRMAVAKGTLFDESARVPFFVCLPGRIPAGVRDDETLVSGVDIMPTILDYAGVPIPEGCCGTSLRPTLDGLASGPSRPPAREYIVAEAPNNVGRMVRSRRHKYITYTDGTQLLFDMEADPLEMRDLAEDPEHRTVLEQHRAWLKEWEAGRDLDPRVRPFFDRG